MAAHHNVSCKGKHSGELINVATVQFIALMCAVAERSGLLKQPRRPGVSPLAAPMGPREF